MSNFGKLSNENIMSFYKLAVEINCLLYKLHLVDRKLSVKICCSDVYVSQEIKMSKLATIIVKYSI